MALLDFQPAAQRVLFLWFAIFALLEFFWERFESHQQNTSFQEPNLDWLGVSKLNIHDRALTACQWPHDFSFASPPKAIRTFFRCLLLRLHNSYSQSRSDQLRTDL